MKNLFSKHEVLISCSSLRNLDLSQYFLKDYPTPKLVVNNNNLKLICKRINSITEANSKKISTQIYTKYNREKKTDINNIILEILLARKYRAGKKEDREPESLYKKIKTKTDCGLPIHLTISLYPCKIPNLLKSGGELADLGELASLARLKEIAMSVGNIYPPGLKITVLLDGYRFKKILNFSKIKINNYQKTIYKMLYLLEAEKHIELCDYVDFIKNNLPTKTLTQKKTLFMSLVKDYSLIFGTKLNVDDPLTYIDNLLKKDANSEIINKFVPLFMSLLYCTEIKDISVSKNKDQLSLKIYTDVFNFNDVDKNINRIRKKLVKRTWQQTIEYIAEISSGRIIKPVDIIYPDSIRCDMHNIFGRLSLYSVNRSTKLTPFHSTGYINDKGKISTMYRIQLTNINFVPVYGNILDAKYHHQAFFYINREFLKKFNNQISEALINTIDLHK